VTWHGNSIPAVMFVESSIDDGKTWAIRGIFEDKHLVRRNGKPLLLLSSSVQQQKMRDENRKLVSTSLAARHWRLRMEGHSPKNKTKRYAIEYVVVVVVVLSYPLHKLIHPPTHTTDTYRYGNNRAKMWIMSVQR